MHRYARCVTYPEWGVGSVTGIYFTGGGDDVQQWARVKFAPGVRTVPAGSLQFVDFSKPDPGADRVQRFLTAAQHAIAEGNHALAAQRLIYARDAEPDNCTVLRLMTLAFWQDGNLPAAGRAVRDWARVDGDRPTAHRYAARIYEDMGAIDLAEEAAQRAAERGPQDADAWARVGRLRLRLMDRDGAIDALEHARRLGPSVEALLDLALAYHLAGDLGAEVTACEQATLLDERSAEAWSRLAHALARTDRVSDAIDACDRALRLGKDPEVAELLRGCGAACRASCRPPDVAAVSRPAEPTPAQPPNASRDAIPWCLRSPVSCASARSISRGSAPESSRAGERGPRTARPTATACPQRRRAASRAPARG